MHDIPKLDAKGLRKFGLTTGAIVVALFGIGFPLVFGFAWPLWPWLVGGVLALWALVAPASLDPIYHGWMRIGLLLSKVTTPIIMGAVFFLVISPVALVMKLARRDPMRRSFDPAAPSYRVKSEAPRPDSLEHPY
jgi:Kef-type K+ transport system membrane component KefB